MKKVLAVALAGVMALGSLTITAGAEDSYNAYIGLQTGSYSFRNAWNDGTYGKSSDYFDHMIVWGDEDDEEGDYVEALAGNYVTTTSFTDAAITGNGEYTVSVNDFDFSRDGAEALNLLFISTDIPLDAGVEISNIRVYVNDEYQNACEWAIVSPDDTEYVNMMITNIWNDDVKANTAVTSYPSGVATLSLKFEVSGMASDADEAGAVAPITVVAVIALVSAGVVVASKKRA